MCSCVMRVECFRRISPPLASTFHRPFLQLCRISGSVVLRVYVSPHVIVSGIEVSSSRRFSCAKFRACSSFCSAGRLHGIGERWEKRPWAGCRAGDGACARDAHRVGWRAIGAHSSRQLRDPGKKSPATLAMCLNWGKTRRPWPVHHPFTHLVG